MESDFATDLKRFGPHGTARPLTQAQAQAYCRHLAHSHYENFSVASLLLPRRLLPHFHAIYAYCRWADDLADEVGDSNDALRLLDWWREELRLCYADTPRHPVMIALQPTIRRFRIPETPFLDLLTAFEQDQRTSRYRTYEELLGYCRNSANPVGHLILYLGEVFEPERAALSDSICTGLQLANFWQDVARDYAIGRVYLPQEDMERFGCGEDDLKERRFTPAFAGLLRFEVDRARGLFHKGWPLIERMPADLKGDVELFARGGLAILDKIEKCGYDVLTRRPALAKWEKGTLLLRVLWRRLQPRGVAPGYPVVPLRGERQPRNSPEGAQQDSPGQRPGALMVATIGPPLTRSESYAWCERLARREAGNFYHAFRILPADQRRAMCALYAFMRITDDIADGPGEPADKSIQLELWRQQLRLALQGEDLHPLHAALRHTIHTYGVPPRYLEEVLDGVCMDLEVTHYQTFAELYRYGYHVASAVGLACIHIWGFRGDEALQQAEAAGIALQLTNILRDLGEDHARGRVYLPGEDLDRFGYSEEDLGRRVRDERFRALMEFEAARAAGYYQAAEPLVQALQPAGQTVFLVILRTYRGLLQAIVRRDYDVFSERVRLSRWHKLWLAATALPVRWGWF